MKKVLFVLHTIELGGSMTSMLNLLELLKEKGYRIDLFLMDHTGALLERAKGAANLLPENKRIANIICKPEKLKGSKNIFGFFERGIFVVLKKLSGGKYNRESVYKKQARKYSGYDTVVSFQETIPTDFVKYIDCKNKVAWVHNVAEILANDELCKKAEKVYRNYNKVVCASSFAKTRFEKDLNLDTASIYLVYNTLNAESIKSKSSEKEVKTNKDALNLISVGRFVEIKGFDRIIPVAKRLKNDGVNFLWRIVGNGALLNEIYSKAEKEGLLDNLSFEGAQLNPYPYIASSDCFVLTSRSETHPMVAIEALLLDKPVLSTDFPSVKEVIIHGVNGLINSNDEYGIYYNIKEIINNKDLFETLKNGAKKYNYDNEKIIAQVIGILELEDE